MTKLLLGTPTADGRVEVEYMRSIMKLMGAASGMNLEIELLSPKGTLIDWARNMFASRVLEDQSYDGLIMIDSDMEFEPDLIKKMIDFNAPVTAAYCPKRHLPIERFYQISREVSSAALAFELSLPFVAEGDWAQTPVNGQPQVPYRDGFVSVRNIGTGLMLVRREALETIKRTCPDIWVESPKHMYKEYLGGGVLQCFAPIKDEDGIFVSEDLAFCRRWRELCGGEIWACITERVGHIGKMAYAGRLQTKLMPRASEGGLPKG